MTESHTIRVLLADDHDMFRQGLGALISVESAIDVVAQVKDGVAAREYITAHLPDVAILDVSMPGLTGIEVCRQLEDAHTRMIILTMHDDLLLAQEALQAGAHGYVLKDNTFDEVVNAIHAAQRNDTFVSPSIRSRLAACDGSFAPLSAREKDVLRLLANGLSVKKIAEELDVSSKSVDVYRARLLEKLGANNTAELIQYAARRALV